VTPPLSRSGSTDELDVLIEEALDEVKCPLVESKAVKARALSAVPTLPKLEAKASKKPESLAKVHPGYDPRFSKVSASTLRKMAEEEARKKLETEEAKRREQEKKAQVAKKVLEEEKKKREAELKEFQTEVWSNARAPSVSQRQGEHPSTPSAVFELSSVDEIPSDYADLEHQIDIDQELHRNFDTMDMQHKTDVEDADLAVPRYLKKVDKTMPQFELWTRGL
jgi:hypothetical protein